MKRFIQGDDRSQSALFPECLDDYIADDNPVRAIEVFVDELNPILVAGSDQRNALIRGSKKVK